MAINLGFRPNVVRCQGSAAVELNLSLHLREGEASAVLKPFGSMLRTNYDI
jgi:hypothetical protein